MTKTGSTLDEWNKAKEKQLKNSNKMLRFNKKQRLVNQLRVEYVETISSPNCHVFLVAHLHPSRSETSF